MSADPPLVLVSLMSGSYPAELFGRAEEPVTRFAVTLLSAGQRVLAGRFAAAGRPGARLMLEDVPHRRGPGLRGADRRGRPGRAGVLGRSSWNPGR